MTELLHASIDAGARGRPRAPRRGDRVIFAAFVLLLQAGCYTYTPSAITAPAPGSTVELEISDRGRVALADRVGSGVAQIEAAVVQVQDSTYQLRVFGVTGIDGRTSHWTGERLDVRRDDFARVYERRFSRSKTITAVLVSAGAFAAIVLTRSLIAGGNASNGGSGGPPQGS